MNERSSKDAREKLLSWRAFHTPLNLTIFRDDEAEIFSFVMVAFVAPDRAWVVLSASTRNIPIFFGEAVDVSVETDLLQFTISRTRYLFREPPKM
jgi:hypothetical protein